MPFLLADVCLIFRFLEILNLTYGPGPYSPGPLGPYGSGPFIIWKNFLSKLCSMTIFEMHTASRACLLYASGAVCFLDMVLKHIWLRKFFQINCPEPYGPGAYGPGPFISRGQNLQKASGSTGQFSTIMYLQRMWYVWSLSDKRVELVKAVWSGFVSTSSEFTISSKL